MSVHAVIRCRILLLPFLVAGCHAPGASGPRELAHWNYSGEAGPAHWGALDAAYATCKSGLHQSPIDLPRERGGGLIGDLHEMPVFDYKEGRPTRLTNNGHTIVGSAAPGSTMTIGGKSYTLRDFHFHARSEHTVGGKPSAMEVHLVHEAPEGEGRALAVVSVLLAEGDDNAALRGLWDKLPGAAGAVDAGGFNPAALLPSDLAYYSYVGSLTVPPCTEGVRWFVMAAQGSASPTQVERFRKLFGGNTARPVQPLNDRVLHRSEELTPY